MKTTPWLRSVDTPARAPGWSTLDETPVITAKCGCLCREDEVCPTCRQCGGPQAEWQGCCRCKK
jgi:hypothetical protein